MDARQGRSDPFVQGILPTEKTIYAEKILRQAKRRVRSLLDANEELAY